MPQLMDDKSTFKLFILVPILVTLSMLYQFELGIELIIKGPNWKNLNNIFLENC